MYNNKLLIVLSGTVVDKFTQSRLLGIFKQYATDRIYVRIKHSSNAPFVKCAKEVMELLEIEYIIMKKQAELAKRKQIGDLNYRLILESDLIILMQKDFSLAKVAMQYNKTILQFKGRRQW